MVVKLIVTEVGSYILCLILMYVHIYKMYKCTNLHHYKATVFMDVLILAK